MFSNSSGAQPAVHAGSKLPTPTNAALVALRCT